jgi:putative intracellular protease/amidase
VAAPLAWAIDKRFDNEGSSSDDYVALVIAGGAGAGALVGWATCQ